VTNEEPRSALLRLANERGLSLAALSAAIRRNTTYLQQWIARGSPRVLAEADRRVLAAMLGCDEEVLGGPRAPEAAFRLPRLDVDVSAGPGAEPGAEELLGTDGLDPALARSLRLRAGAAAVIRVRGDSMEPALRDGDQLVVDTSDREPDGRGGVYVVRVAGVLLVKRAVMAGDRLRLTSDNPAAGPVPSGRITVIGRGVWRMGRV
jgi:repressor LexA